MDRELKKIDNLNLVEKKQKIGNEKIDLFWKAREFKPYHKTIDWYWGSWIITFFLIFVSVYFFYNNIFGILIFLIVAVATLGHRQTPKIFEYRINNEGISLENGKKEIPFNLIENYNIDMDEELILINTKNKYQKLIHIPFEANHNIKIIDKILSSKIEKNSEIEIPFLEKIFNRMLGF